jgi:hypothetical protein
MRGTIFAVCAMGAGLLGYVTHPQTLDAQSVALRGPDVVGQGLLRPRGIGECFVVAPHHVVARAGVIQAVAENGETAEVSVLRPFVRADLAILEQRSGPALPCPPWSVPPDLSARLSDASVGAVLRLRNEDGLFFMPVWIRHVGVETITIAPRDADRLESGMSGSQLLVGGVFAGVLLSVDAESGRGNVLRSDAIDRLVNSFFTGPRNRDPDLTVPPPGGAASEPNLWLLDKQSVVLGNRNTSFGIIYVDPQSFSLRVISNGSEHVMYPGSRLSFADTRGDCFIIYMRADNSDPQNQGEERFGFLVVCNPT